MKFIDLSGRIHNKELNSYKYGMRDISKSKGQNELGKRLKEIFPLIEVFEELPCFGTNLYLDFFIPGMKMAFEFDGRQHEEYNPFFHRTREGYGRSIKNDVAKSQWCEKNGILLLRINENNIDKIREIIADANN